MAKKLAKGQFDLEDMDGQLSQMEKLGGMEGLMGMLPGVQKMKKQITQFRRGHDGMIKRQRAIIGSMTRKERKKPDILQASRKRRIAAGAGVEVSEVNRLLKQHRQMQDAFKAMSRDGGKGFARMAGMFGAAGGPAGVGGLPGMGAPPPSGAYPSSPPGLPGLPNLPGLGGGLPPGFNPSRNSFQEKIDAQDSSRPGRRQEAPYYAIVVADSHSPRDGRSSRRSEAYNPLLKKDDARASC